MLLPVLLLGLAACDQRLAPVEADFSAGVEAVDFGAVLEGTEVVREVPFTNTGRVAVELSLGAEAPFSSPSRVLLPGGATVPVEVRFLAGDGVSGGTLRARAGEDAVEVALRGEGVRALACFPSAVCRASEFVLEARACVERVLEDGTACTPESLCLENGACRGGDCLGTARGCDDGNVCTTDGCAPERGCVHAPVRCPQPSNPCEVAECDPQEGCKVTTLPDGTVCGLTCKVLSTCRAGRCEAGGPPPDGTPCGPAAVCHDVSRCQDEECVQGDARPLAAAWQVELPGAPVSGLRGFDGNVFAAACAGDGGCSLVSRTSAATGGFLRYAAPLSGPAELVSVSEEGVLLLEAGALALRTLAPPGAERWRLSASSLAPPPDAGAATAVTAVDRVVTGSGGEVLAAYSWAQEDGGVGAAAQTLVHLVPDGGVLSASTLEGLGGEGLLAQGEEGTWVLSSPGGEAAVLTADGGTWTLGEVETAPGGRSLVVGGGRVVLGGQAVLAADGGVVPLVFVDDTQPPVQVGHLPVLVEGRSLHVFGEGCARGTGPGCIPALRVYTFPPGATEAGWSAEVLSAEARGRLVEAAVLEASGVGQGLGALTEQPGDGGTLQGVLRLLAGGQQVEQCALPEAPALEQVGAALFEGSALYVAVRRGGQWWLEAYELPGLEASERGWPQAAGVSGSRRAR